MAHVPGVFKQLGRLKEPANPPSSIAARLGICAMIGALC